jgi:hypothetical protein
MLLKLAIHKGFKLNSPVSNMDLFEKELNKVRDDAKSIVKKLRKKGRIDTIHIIQKSFRHHLIEWVATIFTVIGTILNANIFNINSFDTYSVSFYSFFFGNLLWISFAWKHKHWGVFTTFFLLGILNFTAILKVNGII